METADAISKRVSVRRYKDAIIEKKLLEKLVDAGRRAPTARGVEPWKFVVVTQKQTLTELGKIVTTGSFIKDAAACIVVLCEDTKYYLEDGCAATENILLAAADLDLGACWVAGEKKPYAAEVCKMIGAPSNMKLVSLISLGWPKGKITQQKNRSVKDVLHWERF